MYLYIVGGDLFADQLGMMVLNEVCGMSVGIYMITNKLDGKKYIGKSVRLHTRWNEHKRATSNTAISKAIRKYGVDNFEFQV